MKPKLIQILNEYGHANILQIEGISDELMLKMYRMMVLTRIWNGKALSLQRQGRMGTITSVHGQEAANIGMALPLEQTDWFLPSFRDQGVLFTLGVSLKDQLLFWGGYEQGMYIPEHLNIAPSCITVGSHLCHAAGVAYAAKLRKEKTVVLTNSGDGSTSEGDFHESLNMASLFQLPVVFVVQNNHWAISMPFERQSATETISEKAAAYNMESARVDGNDVFAVYKTVKKYVELAREKSQPALIELVTYRIGDHTTADDATRYRTKEVIDEWIKKDPIDRMKKFLVETHRWDEQQDKSLIDECMKQVEQAVKDYEAVGVIEPAEMFKYMYHEMPWHLKEEIDEVKALYKGEDA
ncbi:pyruvate dehydrogenase (acetyl-transferring) E1 component subunit alpha [candidate division KSB1 bacterium]|nr:pyruvate dehydrogenase (acetyl-transferring) E1 component subunit alpha [candidate division KSB1 bacterium]